MVKGGRSDCLLCRQFSRTGFYDFGEGNEGLEDLKDGRLFNGYEDTIGVKADAIVAEDGGTTERKRSSIFFAASASNAA